VTARVALYLRATRPATGLGHQINPEQGLADFMVNGFLMAAMNRLSPLIVRRAGPWAAEWGQSLFAVSEPDLAEAAGKATVPPWLDDLKLFATGWIGGLVFFGTLIG
jgi:hypothetical protein